MQETTSDKVKKIKRATQKDPNCTLPIYPIFRMISISLHNPKQLLAPTFNAFYQVLAKNLFICYFFVCNKNFP